MSTKRLVVLAVLLAIASACSPGKMFEHMEEASKCFDSIKKEIKERYGVEHVGFNVRNLQFFTAGISNSKYNQASEAERRQVAEEIAFIVYNKWYQKEYLQTVAIIFEVTEKRSIFTHHERVGIYKFEASQLKAKAGTAEPT